METFTDLKNFVPDPHFDRQRRQVLDGLQLEFIDAPLVGLIRDLARLPDCFSLQCCYGHFLYDGQQDEHHIGRLPLEAPSAEIEYRIAYLAICLREGEQGWALFQELSKLPVLDPEYIQFGCAGWFWERQVNSYVLQVEPERFKDRDRAPVGYREALYIEQIRDEFFERLGTMIASKVQSNRPD